MYKPTASDMERRAVALRIYASLVTAADVPEAVANAYNYATASLDLAEAFMVAALAREESDRQKRFGVEPKNGAILS